MVNAGVAFPFRAMDCGEFGASSTMLMVAVRSPAASGAKFTAIVQFALTARCVQPVPLTSKSFGLDPPTAMEEMFTA
jgi:hypothetical protein